MGKLLYSFDPYAPWTFTDASSVFLTSWFSCSNSPFQIRKRLSRTSALVYSVSPSSPHPCQDEPPESLPNDSPVLHATEFNSPLLDSDSEPPTVARLTTHPLPPQGKIQNSKINTPYAHQGLHLLLLSLHYIPLNSPFARQLYITALVYFLHSLPPSTHLSETELKSLRSAIPASLPIEQDANKDKNNNGCDQQNHHIVPPASSLPHRTLSTQTFLLLRAIQTLTSYIRYFLSVLAYCDQQYRIREHALTLATSVARETWRRAVEHVDPAFLAWLGTEVAKGIEEGWRRGNWDGDVGNAEHG
ncbi:MAG: hypothetical protein LQ343_007318 [Gyalolechia ehrenbergii]|nr:MAG: hypothetical protein LQ343_007318 [Gyalolechia ehrenbergii]